MPPSPSEFRFCFQSHHRFARSVSHLYRALETFNALGIAFVSLSEYLDTATPGGRDGLHRIS
ncbi:MAG TPA: recombinase family protein [Verrucomicrobiae bacterium]|nr:recombinase family protein [Verrucomicrobiae bacterium]